MGYDIVDFSVCIFCILGQMVTINYHNYQTHDVTAFTLLKSNNNGPVPIYLRFAAASQVMTLALVAGPRLQISNKIAGCPRPGPRHGISRGRAMILTPEADSVKSS